MENKTSQNRESLKEILIHVATKVETDKIIQDYDNGEVVSFCTYGTVLHLALNIFHLDDKLTVITKQIAFLKENNNG